MKSPHRRQKNELNEQSDRNEAFYMPSMLTLRLLLICQLKCDRIDPGPPGVLDRHYMYESSCDRHMNDEIYKTF